MKVIAIALLLTMITGCATTGGTSSKASTAGLECGAVGAGGGYLTCKLLGGSEAMCLSIAAGVGGLGGVACYSLATNFEKRRQELAGKENDVNARLKYVRGLNEDSKKLNQELNSRVAQVSQRTDTIVAQIEKGTISQKEVAKERESLLQEEKAANDQVALEKSALDDMKRFQAEQARKKEIDKAMHEKLDAEIKEQERLLAETQLATKALASQRQRI